MSTDNALDSAAPIGERMIELNDDILAQARDVALEMLESGAEIAPIRVGENGRVYVSTNRHLVIALSYVEVLGRRFYIGINRTFE